MDKNQGTLDNLRNEKQFAKIVKISIIIGIFVVSGFIIYYMLTPEPGFVVFGLLNEEKRAENYPTEAIAGENISFYVSVENYLNRDFTFRIEILKGDNDTILSSTKPAKNATSYYNTTDIILQHNDIWLSEMLNISFLLPGSDQIIIAELWEKINGVNEQFYNNLWLRLNITS